MLVHLAVDCSGTPFVGLCSALEKRVTSHRHQSIVALIPLW